MILLQHIMTSQQRGVCLVELLVNGWLLDWKRRQKLSLVGGPSLTLATELDELEPFFDRALKASRHSPFGSPGKR